MVHFFLRTVLCAIVLLYSTTEVYSQYRLEQEAAERAEKLLKRSFSVPRKAELVIYSLDRDRRLENLRELEYALLFARLNYGMRDLSRLRRIQFFERIDKMRYRLNDEGELTLEIPSALPWKAWVGAFTRAPLQNPVFLEYIEEVEIEFLEDLLDDEDYHFAQFASLSSEEGLNQYVDEKWLGLVRLSQSIVCEDARFDSLEENEGFKARIEEAAYMPVTRVKARDSLRGYSLDIDFDDYSITIYRGSGLRNYAVHYFYIDRKVEKSLIPVPLYHFDLNQDCEIKASEYFIYDEEERISHREWRDEEFRLVRHVEANEEPLLLEDLYANLPDNLIFRRPLDEVFATAERNDRVVVTLLDTGIDYNHPYLAYKILRDENGYLIGKDLEEQDGRPYDFKDSVFDNDRHFDHGTHVGGIIVEDTDEIVLLPMSYALNSERMGEGIRWAYEQGSRIVNISLGSKRPGLWEHLEQAIQDLPDMLFVVAAGNDGEDLAKFPKYPARFQYENVITVAATDKNNRLTDFSNFSETLVDIAALGKQVLSFTPGLGRAKYSGTSMATPRVARAAGLLLFENPGLSAARIRELLCESATATRELESKTECGGYLDLEAARVLAKEKKSRLESF